MKLLVVGVKCFFLLGFGVYSYNMFDVSVDIFRILPLQIETRCMLIFGCDYCSWKKSYTYHIISHKLQCCKMFEPSQVLRWISSNFRHWCRWHGRSDLLQCCSSPHAWRFVDCSTGKHRRMLFYLVVSNVFCFHPVLGRCPVWGKILWRDGLKVEVSPGIHQRLQCNTLQNPSLKPTART